LVQCGGEFVVDCWVGGVVGDVELFGLEEIGGELFSAGGVGGVYACFVGECGLVAFLLGVVGDECDVVGERWLGGGVVVGGESGCGGCGGAA